MKFQVSFLDPAVYGPTLRPPQEVMKSQRLEGAGEWGFVPT